MKNFYEKNSLKNPLSSKLDFGMPTLIELNSIKENTYGTPGAYSK